ncbi:MAG: hypothetical protein ACYCUG_03555 [Acidimicrobiales bacterium]
MPDDFTRQRKAQEQARLDAITDEVLQIIRSRQDEEYEGHDSQLLLNVNGYTAEQIALLRKAARAAAKALGLKPKTMAFTDRSGRRLFAMWDERTRPEHIERLSDLDPQVVRG